MKILIKILFIALLCLPFTLSAQWTDSGTYMRTNDKVGISVNPAEKLHINGSVRGNQNGALRISTGNGYVDIGPKNSVWAHFTTDRGKFYFNKEIRVNTGFIGSYNQDLSLRTQGTTRMTILKSNGNVGVGTTTPAEKLHVNGSVRGNRNGALRISTGNGYVDIGPKNTVWAHFTTDRGKFYFNKEIRVNTGFIGSYNQNLSLRTQGTTRMTILKSNGNVGIGTTTPNNKLDVNGTIRAKEIKVESGWSDYVFYNDYQLPTLEEEEKHIEKNGHLLGFESEKAMDGEIQLGDVSRRQQAKIEEMMLHLIELKKEMTHLKEENEELKKLLKAEKE